MKQHMNKGYIPENGCSFYVVRTYNDRKTLQKLTGYRFEKDGYSFGVARNEHSRSKADAWFIYDLETGLAVSIASSAGKAAKDAVTAELMQEFSSTRERDKAVFSAMYDMRMQAAEIVAREQGKYDADGFYTVNEQDAEEFCSSAAEIVRTGKNHSEPVATAENHSEKSGKDFIGTEITGNGWRIVFSADTERTQIFFSAEPVQAAKELMETEKFFYSGKMKSYNKRLTMKAYRAAQRVAQQLNRIYPAA